MTESGLVRKIVKTLRERFKGIYVRKNHGSPYVTKGRPDLEIIHRGVPVFLEVKLPSGAATPTQLAEGELILAAGATWAIVQSVDEALDVVKEALDRLR